mmetsp:Transcript_12611/g.18539  ORF Transcript_12611/g.18539 Transcript_12611/m.18539 type:complete len:185 (-) Transcript_12611:870-1424(-)|eukprot:CAMPEP_0194211692 /NCGR_PEP_ID=MMETSP0156-20130528/10895_1 /TAXON_ID=33649 /ORGANISM="Thalassionema nitzschioides, Strain L26-B" /LENGTH=184 /DNA_ID=CAMNT_0038939319 /DNA_START=26 /DNA_END=583 /DNA_ORIENTATION=+
MHPVKEVDTSNSVGNASKAHLCSDPCEQAEKCDYANKEEVSHKSKNIMTFSSLEVADSASSSSERMINNDSDHNGKRKQDKMSNTEDDRLEERRAKNRISAHQSRLRKGRQLQYLQEQLIALGEEKKKLEETNYGLSLQLATTQAENTKLQAMHQNSMRIAAALQLQSGQIPDNSGVIPPLVFF